MANDRFLFPVPYSPLISIFILKIHSFLVLQICYNPFSENGIQVD